MKKSSHLFSKNSNCSKCFMRLEETDIFFLPSMLAKRSFHFGGLIASLSLIKCQAVNTNRIICFQLHIYQSWEFLNVYNFMQWQMFWNWCSQLFLTFVPAIRTNILTSAQDFFVFKQPIKKIELNLKILCPQSPSILMPRPLWLRDEKRAMGTRMTFSPSRFCLAGANSLIIPGRGTARGKHLKLLAFGLMLIG